MLEALVAQGFCVGDMSPTRGLEPEARTKSGSEKRKAAGQGRVRHISYVVYTT